MLLHVKRIVDLRLAGNQFAEVVALAAAIMHVPNPSATVNHLKLASVIVAVVLSPVVELLFLDQKATLIVLVGRPMPVGVTIDQRLAVTT
jgi:hypothetical protein